MRLLIVSDVHLEFGAFTFPADLPEFDAAVFAGDIHQPVTAAVEWLANEREAGALRGKPVVYVPGNHEFYRHEIKSELAKGQAAADEAGIHLLNRRAVMLAGPASPICSIMSSDPGSSRPDSGRFGMSPTMRKSWLSGHCCTTSR